MQSIAHLTFLLSILFFMANFLSFYASIFGYTTFKIGGYIVISTAEIKYLGDHYLPYPKKACGLFEGKRH